MMDRIEDAVCYFKEREGFRRLFIGLKEKYESLGTFGGTIVLNHLTTEEKELFSGFFQKSYYEKERATISVSNFQKALNKTKYKDLLVDEIVNGYFGTPLVWKKEERNHALYKREKFFQDLLKDFEGTLASGWLLRVLQSKTMPYTLIVKDYEKNRGNLIAVLEAINQLPVWHKDYERITVFSAKITGNPHFFDKNQWGYKVLIYGIYSLCMEKDQMQMKGLQHFNAEAQGELLFSGGLLKDDISNFVTCIGLVGTKRDGQEHRGLTEFAIENQPLQLSLMNLSQMEAITTFKKSKEPMKSPVYILENPSVFSDLIDKMKGQKQYAMVCSCGQVKLATIILLDKLVKSGCMLYYSGDFDPEGLLIADKLKSRYGEMLTLWHFEEEEYWQAKSNESISENRLKQLEKLTDPKLIAMGMLLKREKKAGYQELCNMEVYDNEKFSKD